MKPSDQQTQARIERFKSAILKKWKCKADFKCDSLSYDGNTLVSVLELSEPPATFPEAKQCFVWDDKNLKSGDDETVALLDMQVPSHDEGKLPTLAVWYWRNKKAIQAGVYAKSKWSKDELNERRILLHNDRFQPKEGQGTNCKLFVRENAGGKIAVWVIQPNDHSLQIYPNEVEKIERLQGYAETFWLKI